MRTIRLLLGSIVVYIFVACASAVSSNGPPIESLDGSAPGSSDSQPGAADSTVPTGSAPKNQESGALGAIVDALTDPVSSASAQTMTSGSRLKAKWYVGSDGARQFAGWHDSQLNVDCDFGQASDGTIRCLPPPAGVTIGTQGYFSDAGCTQMLGVTDGCGHPTPTNITVTTTSAPGSAVCSATTQTYAAGPQFTGTIFQGTPASCSQISDALATDFAASWFAFYSLGAAVQAINPSQYVQATVQTDP
jgi:hypothetical protein